jgi:hypothetical protein
VDVGQLGDERRGHERNQDVDIEDPRDRAAVHAERF